ncbi:TIGR02611 family protein [Streptomyces sp. 5K101]|uniref:TIGR02611 family protein n=1 Tax=Streptomyces sp. 5K101 TaxID=3390037 RepID=UPI003975BBEC
MNAQSDERDEAVAAVAAAPATGDVTTGAARPAQEAERVDEPALGSRAPHFIKRSRTLHISWQVGVFVVGLAVVGAGAAMLVLPGPGWVVIFGGMAIWATEFVWAQLVLRWTKRKVTEAAQRALDPKVRRRNIILTTIGLVIVAVLVGIYLVKFGLVMPWKIDE